ncbi:hypothetical protein COCCADRAFT_26172 [Bipolaris zeicola 26-R-13]|uniref:Uncharacterized protein n=1 Tax=Cochliobolus carbonum (strain 26-R-13) TaxID=930089 RepID=W6Y1B4_COCC2|nr:uncharacterized protein COCCADRAFT_26172 [Bipolaris zeicola 26-R-13]EUC33547.1 hypothetical protein COCCADRAFT_26172 [Bipolaris zeicola 26-R-13]
MYNKTIRTHTFITPNPHPQNVPNQPPDLILASTFTCTTHVHAAPTIPPSNPSNQLPPGLTVLIIGARRRHSLRLRPLQNYPPYPSASSLHTRNLRLGHQASTEFRHCSLKFWRASLAIRRIVFPSLRRRRLVERLAGQYRGEGVLTVAVHPGAVNTEMASEATPESLRAYLSDDVGLCGAFCVWLSCEKRMWLNGRLLSASWDVDELVEKKDEIEDRDMLKFGYRVGNI